MRPCKAQISSSFDRTTPNIHLHVGASLVPFVFVSSRCRYMTGGYWVAMARFLPISSCIPSACRRRWEVSKRFHIYIIYKEMILWNTSTWCCHGQTVPSETTLRVDEAIRRSSCRERSSLGNDVYSKLSDIQMFDAFPYLIVTKGGSPCLKSLLKTKKLSWIRQSAAPGIWLSQNAQPGLTVRIWSHSKYHSVF